MDGKVTGQCPQTTTCFEEKGEPKRISTEVLTSLTPYRWAKPSHSQERTSVIGCWHNDAAASTENMWCQSGPCATYLSLDVSGVLPAVLH